MIDNIINQVSLEGLENIHPGFSIDCVIFSYSDNNLKVLLNKFFLSDSWMLPGGVMKEDEDLTAAANRILEERTGLKNVYLKQFHLFGERNRIDIEENKKFMVNYGISPEEFKPLLTRHISAGYFAFVRYDELDIEDRQDDNYKWFNLNEIPQLYGDHNNIIDTALKMIRLLINYIPIGYELLPEKFTIVDLRKIYESIFGKSFDDRNFTKKMLTQGFIIKLDERKVTRTYPHPFLYIFNKEKLKEFLL
ncbi:MAG: NUDIX hydrolase [Prevotella sp.]|jgi:hypothetical protein|nr:NUDIX hydrolase [Prevotella sp.]